MEEKRSIYRSWEDGRERKRTGKGKSRGEDIVRERIEEEERERRRAKRRGQDILRERMESGLGRYKLVVGMSAQGAKVRPRGQAEELETTRRRKDGEDMGGCLMPSDVACATVHGDLASCRDRREKRSDDVEVRRFLMSG